MQDVGSNGWIGATFDYDDGGMQMPHILMSVVYHILHAANNHMNGYVGLTAGADTLIRNFGTRELYNQFAL